MKILHVFKTYYPETYGGVEEVIHQLASAAAKDGHEVTVLAVGISTKKWSTDEGYTVERFRNAMSLFPVPFSFALMSRYKKIAQEADVLHFHYPYPFSDLLHLLFSRRRPAVLTYHSDLIKPWPFQLVYSVVRRLFLGSVTKIVATSQNYVNSSRTLRKTSTPVEVVPLGINESDYVNKGIQYDDGYKAQFPSGFILFLGALRKYKGLNELLLASANVKMPIVIAGDGPMRQVVVDKIEALNLSSVYLIGAVSHERKCSLLRSCHALVLPSNLRSEAFGIALIEGAMSAKPLISCEIGTGTTFVNIHGETGLVTVPERPDLLANTLNELASDSCEVKRMGINARARFEDFFRAQEMYIRYFQIYERLVSANVEKEH